jgi:hypothetical protein
MFLKQNADGIVDDVLEVVKQNAGTVAGNVIESVKGEVKQTVDKVLEAKRVEFWTVWYAANRNRTIVPIPFRPVKVKDLRALFEEFFGPMVRA